MKTAFSSRLKEYRKRRGLSQEQLAELCKIPYSSYCRYERGVGEPPLSVAIALAQTLQVSLDLLCGLSAESGEPAAPAEEIKARLLLQKIRKLLDSSAP